MPPRPKLNSSKVGFHSSCLACKLLVCPARCIRATFVNLGCTVPDPLLNSGLNPYGHIGLPDDAWQAGRF